MTLQRTWNPQHNSSSQDLDAASWPQAGRGPETEFAQHIWPHPYSHQISIMRMQMHSEKAWDMTSYQAGPRLLEVMGLCQFHLTQFSVMILCIDLPGNWSFCVKTLRQSKKIIWWGGNDFPQRPSGYRSQQREDQRMISVSIIMAYHCPLSPRLKISFLAGFSPWWICAWTNFCCLREQRPFWAPSQGQLVSHHMPLLTWWPPRQWWALEIILLSNSCVLRLVPHLGEERRGSWPQGAHCL